MLPRYSSAIVARQHAIVKEACYSSIELLMIAMIFSTAEAIDDAALGDASATADSSAAPIFQLPTAGPFSPLPCLVSRTLSRGMLLAAAPGR